MPDTHPIKRIVNVTHYSHHHGNLCKEAANQQFKMGNLLSLNASGEAVPTAAGAAAASAKNFLAARNSENSATPRPLPRVTPQPNMVFEVTATGAAATAALLQPGKRYGYKVDPTTGLGVLDLTDTANAVWELTAHNGDTLVKGRGALQDTNVGVYARLLAQ